MMVVAHRDTSRPGGAGMCISVFAVIGRGRKALVGIPKRHRRWRSEWVSGWLMYSSEDLDEIHEQHGYHRLTSRGRASRSRASEG